MFPLLRKFMNTMKIFYVSFCMAMAGYGILLILSVSGAKNIYLLLIPAFLIMAAIGMLNVIVTVFLANTVDYGELKNDRRDESVIFSMQTFVVKLASGVSALIASLVLAIFNISEDEEAVATISGSSQMGLRMCMTLIPIVVLLVAIVIFKKKYILTDEKLAEITTQLKARKGAD